MAVAKNPGAGRGKGGGRPSRGETRRFVLDLSPEAGQLLDAEAERLASPPWAVVDGLVLEHLGGVVRPAPPAPAAAPQPAPMDESLAREVARALMPRADPQAVVDGVKVKLALPKVR